MNNLFMLGLGGRVATNMIFALAELGQLERLKGFATKGVKDLNKLASELRKDKILGLFPGSFDISCEQYDGLRPEGYGRLLFRDKVQASTFSIPVYTSDAFLFKGAGKQVFDEVDVAIDASGHNYTLEGAERFLQAGAKKVIFTGPPTETGIPQIIYPINGKIDTGLPVVSLASCTTNAIVPVAEALARRFGSPRSVLFNTVHAATNSQRLLGSLDNIVGQSSGAAQSLQAILPDIRQISGYALRVPVTNGSFVAVYMGFQTFDISTQDIAEALREGCNSSDLGKLLGVDCYTKFESDNVLCRHHTAVVKLEEPYIQGGEFISALIGYDNEYAYSYQATLAALNCPLPS